MHVFLARSTDWLTVYRFINGFILLSVLVLNALFMVVMAKLRSRIMQSMKRIYPTADKMASKRGEALRKITVAGQPIAITATISGLALLIFLIVPEVFHSRYVKLNRRSLQRLTNRSLQYNGHIRLHLEALHRITTF